MILSNRRHRITYISLAGMDIAILLPFMLTWIARGQRWTEFSLPSATNRVLESPLLLYGVCWMTMIGYMVIIDLLDRRKVDSPHREIIILLLVVSTSVLSVRFVLYPLADYTKLAWLKETALAVVDFSDGLLPPLALILVNAFVWIRVAVFTDRELGFFSVGVSFRLGLLLSILGGALLTTMAGYPTLDAITYFALFFACGLVAVAVARIDEKTVGINGVGGSVIPLTRLAEMGGFIVFIFGATAIIQTMLNPTSIRKTVAFLNPVWNFIGWVFTTLILAIFLVIGPIIERFMNRLKLFSEGAKPLESNVEVGPPTDFVMAETMVREWHVLRYCLVTGLIIAVMAVIWIYFLKPDGEGETIEEEDEPTAPESSEGIRPGFPSFGNLRNWFQMLRKYGISQGLLSAVSIENMYANLGRLARDRGHPRAPSLPPDKYLPELAAAFPDCDEQLARITDAYMQVHYGDMSIDRQILEQIGEDYALIVESPQSAEGE